MKDKILLVDGHSIANRAFYGVPLLSNSQGVYTNAVYGFINIFMKVVEMEKPDRAAVAFDLKAPTFRHNLYAQYKGNRSPMPDELHMQIPIIQEILDKAGIQLLMMEGFEADDILGTIAKRHAHQGDEVTVLSGDRDLLQLAEENLKILIPKTKKGGTELETYFPADVEAKYGVSPDGYLQMKALMGDPSDNIPGVPAIGEKTAAKIIREYESVENAIAHAAQVKPARAGQNLEEFQEQARLSLTLATICTDCAISEDVSPFSPDNFQNPAFIQVLKQYEFKSLLERFLPKSGMAEQMSLMEDQGLEETEPAQERQDLHRVQSREEWRALCQRLEQAPLIAMEILEEGESIQGLSLCSEEECAWWVETSVLPWSELAGDLKSIMEDERILKIGHNFKEEYRAFFSCGVQPKGVGFDTMIAAYLINPSKDTYTIDELSAIYLGEFTSSEIEVLGSGSKKLSLLDLSPERRTLYAASLAQIVYRAYPKMKQELRDKGMESLFYEVELPLVEVLASMEQMGIKVDVPVLNEIGRFLTGELAKLTETIYDMAGGPFNINSPKQLGEVLFERLELPVQKKTKSGYSTSAEVLEKLNPLHPIIGNILLFRQLGKLQSTYVEGLAPYIHREDGKIHSRFQQTVTATGRLSSTDPNLQNIPIRMELGRQLRKAFVPENSDFFFMDADYSQIELRLLAHMSGDEKMIEAYQRGEDIHRLTAAQVLGVSPEDVTPAQRNSAKAVNFGIIYGISAFSLSDDLHISQKEASEYIKAYFQQYPKVKGFLEECVESARERGYGVTIFGRRRNIDELKSKNFNMRSFGERVAKNMPIQGSAADIIKIAMVRVYQRVKREKLRSRLLLQVHDELLMEVYRPEEEAVRRILEEEMTGAADLKVPLEIDIHTGENWYEAK